MNSALNTPSAGNSRLRITEIFLSLQGEARSVGWPTVFVRLTGCPLRCAYCDTAYAFTGGAWMELNDICERVSDYGVRHVTVTGGEPLAQRGVHALMSRLCNAGLEVSLETSGALDVGLVDPRVAKVLDLKTPGSGEAQRNLWSNLEHLGPSDQVKIVITDRADYEWARDRLGEYDLTQRVEVLLSPVHGRLAPRELAEWMLEDRLHARMQVQLHKYLWGDEPGR